MADYKNVNIRNKRATFDYEILEEYASFVNFRVKKGFIGKNHGFFSPSLCHKALKLYRNFIETSRYISPKTKAQSHPEKALTSF